MAKTALELTREEWKQYHPGRHRPATTPSPEVSERVPESPPQALEQHQPARTAADLTREEWKQYHPGWHRPPTWPPDVRERAWAQARRAAQILRDQFGATRVVVFGSLAHNLWYSEQSDIDLAVWGIKPEKYFTAIGAVEGVISGFEFNLVDPQDCFPSIRESIEEEGVAV
ncbi:MAG: nucleotidyltransferase domain-containing protein [Chloroflexi bacterium]|nr:nucleotidyltransferase domain-containing protein [Chloroflexota bacterium]